ncbi:hypothetical protein M6I34_02755 [Burkholderiaceae bacterium FT117]|uniref:hypothetical protein n=1 Tax=Zeimonas sediminis TaxID=2944268 RepID=UPI002342FF6D|nr:hypothetical protein [Zeimonas sediminis]MCM5569418.1 hypothetical protein [Zeimonas sediminis]
MSACYGDTLLYRNRVFRLGSRPLEHWFRLVGARPALRRPSHLPADAPDYSATWEVGEDGMLRLVGLTGSWPDTNPLALGHLFPFADDSVVASWYTGTLRGSRTGPLRSALASVRRPDPAQCPGNPAAGLLLSDLALEFRCGRLLDASGEPFAGRQAEGEFPRWAATLV